MDHIEKRKFTLVGPHGIKLHIDETQAFANDPGNGTPALVEYYEGTSTYWCAVDEGIVDTYGKGDIEIPDDCMDWLNSDKVSEAVESIRYFE